MLQPIWLVFLLWGKKTAKGGTQSPSLKCDMTRHVLPDISINVPFAILIPPKVFVSPAYLSALTYTCFQTSPKFFEV